MRDLIITLLMCSVTMSVISLFYMGITPLLSKRYSERGRYYVWLVIVLGLIIPFRPQWDNAIVKINVPAQTVAPIARNIGTAPVVFPGGGTTVPADASIPAQLNIEWWQIASAVWLSGFAVAAIYHAVRHYRFMKTVKRWCEGITDEEALSLFRELKTEMGINRDIKLCKCPSVGSPMIISFANPRILLPVQKLALDELRLILKHELTHYERKDLHCKLLVLLAVCIHWFNPVVYLMARAVDTACELSCDAEVVNSVGINARRRYSEAIIGVARYQLKLKTSLSTNFYGGKKGMKKRVFSIMDTGKKKAGLCVVCAALVATLGTGFAFAMNNDTVKPSGAAMQTATINGETWYLIETEAQLRSIGYADYPLTGKYMQNSDIILSKAEDWTPIGTADAPFTGAFIGNGFEIIDLTIKNADVSMIGMFAYAQNAVIGNVILRNPDIEGAFQDGDSISPFVVFGLGGNKIYDNQVVNYTAVAGSSDPQAAPVNQGPLPEYEQFGISYDANDDMLFEGRKVRYFWDGAKMGTDMYETRYEYLNEDGVVDVRTVRGIIDNGDGSIDPFGELLDIKTFIMDLSVTGGGPIAQTEVRVRNGDSSVESYAGGRTFTGIFMDYKDFGIEYEADTPGLGNLYYQGMLVKTFIDEKADGSIFMFSSVDGGDIVIRTVYDANGKCTGVISGDAASMDLSAGNSDSYLSDTSKYWLEKSKPYAHLGVSVDESAGLLMYGGKPVREIFDPVTGEIISETLGASGFYGRNVFGAVDLTVQYENGKPSGFKVSTQAEYDKRTEERRKGETVEPTEETRAELYAEYSAVGMTYDIERDSFWYDGKVVRYFYDEDKGRAFTDFSSPDFADYDKAVDLKPVYTNGNLTGLAPESEENFNTRMEKHLRITSYVDFNSDSSWNY